MPTSPYPARRPAPTTPALRELVDRVQALIEERGWNWSDLGAHAGYSRKHAKSLATGRTLSAAGFKALDDAFGTSGDLLRLRDRAIAEREASLHGYTPEPPPGETQVVVRGAAPVPSTMEAGDPASPNPPREVSPTNRRDLLALIGSGVAAGGVMPILTPADRLLLLEGTARADSILPVVDAQIASCVSAYRTTTPAVLLGQIASAQSLIDGISAKLTLRPADHARLWHAATIAAGLRGWVHNNAGETASARISLAEAHKRADLLDDDQLIAWTRYMQAIVEDYAGNPKVAQRYAEDGLRHAHTGPSRALLLSDPVAGTRATLGDVDGVDRAVGESLDILHSLTPEEKGPIAGVIIDNIDTCHPANAATTATLAYARLGRPDRVRKTLTTVRPIIEAESAHQRPYMLLDEALAVSRSNDRDPHRIAGLTTQGLALALPFQAAHVGKRADAILRAVEPLNGHPAIGDLRDSASVWRKQQQPSLPA
ncbi:conserved hypothetical protein [Frankia canadensis]|uniref:HTH cro/C1-type domain-containing protein n=1 Tax=Frankia canadensis TaxID=1836972 RepID=A0A2I2KR13_9ACTN|nr:hypothetical protein [Frankia canadensis]SNQ48107.1 conserved hypothetical protein [Frankia canadensis]SOU55397.1 conserved hypothetical protein [Frankia canadensis]